MKSVLGYTRYCLECGGEMPYGREGRRFCDSVCKNRYHNRLRNMSVSMKRQTVDVIDTNYEILSSMMKMGVESATLAQLERIGFNREHLTGIGNLQGKVLQCMCYDIEYYMGDTNIFGLRKNIPTFAVLKENKPTPGI